MMATQTNSTAQAASVPERSNADQIADLLVGEEELDNQDPDLDESDDVEEDAEVVAEAEPEAEDDDEEVSWAGVLKVDESKLVLDEDGNFKAVKVKIDGKEDDVDLNTLITGYQTAKSTTQKAQALAEQKREFDQAASQAITIFRDKLKDADEFNQLLHKKFVSEYEGINWDQLRSQNPAEYAAARADFQQRQNDIANMAQAIKVNREAAENAAVQQQQSARAEFIKEQAARTLEMFPEWRDTEKARKDFEIMSDFTAKFGFSKQEFADIADPRVLAMLKSVVSIEEAKAESVKKAAKPAVPKFVQGNRRRNARPVSRLDKLVKRAKTATGSEKRAAQTDAIAELLTQR